MTHPIPRQRARQPPHDALSGRTGHLHDMARRLIRDAIRHYPGARVNALGLNHTDARALHRLICTADLHDIRLDEGDTQ